MTNSLNNRASAPVTGRLIHVTYIQKFIIIGILFAISFFTSTYFMIKAQNTSIQFNELELKGNIYERSLKKLLENIFQHEWLEYIYLNGETSVEGEIFNFSTEINADFKYLIELDQKLQLDLATAPFNVQIRNLPNLKISELSDKWTDLNKHLASLSPEQSNKLHDELLDDLNLLILHVGEASNLILDPTLAGNYLTGALIFHLPKSESLIPKMAMLAHNLLSQQKLDLKKKEELLLLSNLLKENLEKNKKNFNNVFLYENNITNNNEIENKIKEPLYQYTNSINELLKYTHEKILDIEIPSGKSSDYFINASRAFDNSFILWDITNDQLDKIIISRIIKYKNQQITSLAITIICILAGLLFAFLAIREISKSLTNLIQASKKLSLGDFSTRVAITSHDTFGQLSTSFNHMAEFFQIVVEKLKQTTTQLTTSINAILSAAKQQKDFILQQESNTSKIALVARDVSNSGKEFNKTMHDVSNNAHQTSIIATSGKASLTQMEVIMQQMVDSAQNIAAKLATLNEKASNITTVITTITKVSDQTNLLSLNAAIEAEKAGEHGQTFSVIAREIRRLADQTANVTQDIEKMVNEMVSAVSAGVMSVDKFSEEIHSGVNQVSIVGEQISEIIDQVQKQSQSFENVNKGIQAELLGVEQITNSITQISETAQQTSTSIHQFHVAIEQLTTITKQIQTITGTLYTKSST